MDTGRSTVRQDICVGLQELDEKAPAEQAKFWASCVLRKSKELEDIGGLAPDEIYNDVLTRYFDSSVEGLQKVFALCARDQSDHALAEKGLLSVEGLQDALVEHFQYYPVGEDGKTLQDEAKEHFERLAGVLGEPINEASFAYAMRRMRIAILLNLYGLAESTNKVYHIDFDDDNIFTEFEGPIPGKSRTIWRNGHSFRIPTMGEQAAIKAGAFEEYFFTTKQKRRGTVHWVHLQRPKIELVLAIGQIYRMPGTIQTTMRNLKSAQPQIHLNRSREQHHHLPRPLRRRVTAIEIFGDPSYEWSSLIYPGLCIDYDSRRSLEKYDKWFFSRQRRHTREAKKVTDEPPQVLVAVVEYSVGVIWSDSGTSTIVTTCGQASYIGKWITDIATEKEGQSRWRSFLASICCCCRRGKRSDGYEEVPTQSESDDEFDTESPRDNEKSFAETHSMIAEAKAEVDASLTSDNKSGLEANDATVSRVTFDGIFEKTLMALWSQNSLLRTGTNEQLMTRIILNSTQEYLDAAALYGAAIHRLDWLLEKPNLPDKDQFIEKIEDAKLELGHLLRIVEPFQQYVLPTLRDLSSPLEIVVFQIKDIDNNINTFIPKCKSLIQQCESLTDSYDRKASAKMNSILNILTFITFVITPMQLLTGLYGMNFKVMPELDWHHGYTYFWMMSVSLSFVFALILYKMTQE